MTVRDGYTMYIESTAGLLIKEPRIGTMPIGFLTKEQIEDLIALLSEIDTNTNDSISER